MEAGSIGAGSGAAGGGAQPRTPTRPAGAPDFPALLDAGAGVCRHPPRRIERLRELWGHGRQMAAILRARLAGRPRFRFAGSAEAICNQVVERCWNGRFLATSLGHYPDVWIRDLGLCAEALIHRGHRERLGASLAFALAAYERAGRVTTVVRASGYAQDIYGEPADATPLLLRSLALLGDRHLTERHRGFLEKAAVEYLLDHGCHPKEGFKDTVVRGFSTYEIAMQQVLLRAAEATAIPLPPILAEFRPERLLRTLWRDGHFATTPEGDGDQFSADATILPFVLTDATTGDMLAAVLAEIRRRELDVPFPLVFSDPPHSEVARLLPRLTAPGYQADTIWSIFGALTILLARRAGETVAAERYASAYADLIRATGTFYELFTRDGTPYQSYFYRSSEGMLWAALYLDAIESPIG